MDVFSESKRSEVMSLIRSKNTRAELVIFSYLRKQGIYFQKHYSRALGTPDIALPRKKKAVFVDSDFWHGRTLNKLKKRRGNKDDYWVKKISGNVRRDKQKRGGLVSEGWEILIVWEEDVLRKRTRDETLRNIKNFLTKQ